jgi:hypothetical protein
LLVISFSILSIALPPPREAIRQTGASASGHRQKVCSDKASGIAEIRKGIFGHAEQSADDQRRAQIDSQTSGEVGLEVGRMRQG